MEVIISSAWERGRGLGVVPTASACLIHEKNEPNDDFVRCRIAMKMGIGSFMQVYIP